MQSAGRVLSLFGSAIVFATIVGCSFPGSKEASVVEGPTSFARYHEVQSGETLYSIASKYGMNPARIAKENGVTDPTKLRVGQKIGISAPSSVPIIPSTRTAVNDKPKPVQETPAATTTTAAAATAATAATTAPKASTSAMFAWPASGNVIKKFGGSNNGIDIGGAEGDPVYAAADGQVIYVGQLRGYGNLVIVNHNQTYNTAYGFNKTISVKEHDSVKKGQQIATMGKADSGGAKLHFEIRKASKPVDPTTLLPAR